MTVLREGPSRWLLRFGPQNSRGVALFCFPYAGGSPAVFQPWGTNLAAHARVTVVQWPGRGTQLGIPPFRRLLPLARKLARVLQPCLVEPFWFFGHSLGALVAFEVARELRSLGGPLPGLLFASAHRAPQIASRSPTLHRLGDEDFVSELTRLRGSPSDLIESDELRAIFLPVLRADFEVDETYEYRSGPPLPCPIIALGGMNDRRVAAEDLEGWGEHTSGRFALKLLPGDHFFLLSEGETLLQILSQELLAQGGEGYNRSPRRAQSSRRRRTT